MSNDNLIQRGDAVAVDARIYRLNVEALAEIKATVDGQSDQPVKTIIDRLLAEIAALPAAAPVGVERVQHLKRGSTYRVIGHAHVQTDHPLSDYATVVVYQGEADGLYWCRPIEEFEDGRFAALAPLDATPIHDNPPDMADRMAHHTAHHRRSRRFP